jgi:hypothetical protein
MSPGAATNCITLTIFSSSLSCRIRVAEENAGGIVVRKIDDMGFRLGEPIQDNAESLGFPVANIVSVLQVRSSAVQF